MDLVYVIDHSDVNEELRFSLRSLKNLPHGQIFLAGYTPNWVQDVISIDVPQVAGSTRFESTTRNLQAAMEDPRVSDDFIYMNDDFFIMRPTKEVPILHRGAVRDVIKEYEKISTTSKYVVGMLETLKFMLEKGWPEPLSYELHAPMPMNKAKLLQTLEVGASLNQAHKRTIYGNMFRIGGKFCKDMKIDRLNTPWPEDPMFLSTDEASFASHRIGWHIRKQFPEQCKYEK